MAEYRKTSHSIYDIKYHVVWITKYRKPVLSLFSVKQNSRNSPCKRPGKNRGKFPDFTVWSSHTLCTLICTVTSFFLLGFNRAGNLRLERVF